MTFFLFAMGALVWLACSGLPESLVGGATPAAARGGHGGGGSGSTTSGPTVSAIAPDTVSQDTTLDVTVTGSSFDDGSTVEITANDTAVAGVTTNRTRYVNSRKLVASLTLSSTASIGTFDVTVITTHGRKGVGSELLTIQRKGNPNAPIVTMSLVDPLGPADLTHTVFSDGLGSYVGGVDHVALGVARQLVFDAYDDTGTGPIRSLCFRFTAGQETSGAGVPADLAVDLDSTGRTCVDAGLGTVWHSNDDLGLTAMTTVGSTIRAEARSIWQDAHDHQFKLGYFCPDDRGKLTGAVDCPNLVDVTLEDLSVSGTDTTRVWRLTSEPAASAVLYENILKGKGSNLGMQLVASFKMPIDLTVEQRPPGF